jgi:NTP pyrophosphatase (non-canonical NTP hydrolase)
MNELIAKIEQWAEDRNIIKGSKPIDQAMKLFSEFGELADNVGKGRDCRDDIGDVFVVLTIMAKQYGISMADIKPHGYVEEDGPKRMITSLCRNLLMFSDGRNRNKSQSLEWCLGWLIRISHNKGYTLEECVQIAYDDIKNRRGILVNGVFIKESDPAYASAIAAIEENYSA